MRVSGGFRRTFPMTLIVAKRESIQIKKESKIDFFMVDGF
jgi:hypothetical protein